MKVPIMVELQQAAEWERRALKVGLNLDEWVIEMVEQAKQES